MNRLDLGDLFDHPGLDRLDRHRRDTAAGAGAAELDRDLAVLTVEVADGGVPAVHLNLREVAPQEVRDPLAEVVVRVSRIRAHARELASGRLMPLVRRDACRENGRVGGASGRNATGSLRTVDAQRPVQLRLDPVDVLL